MSQPDDTPAAAGEAPAPPPPKPATRRYRRIAIGLAGALLVVAVAVASAPLWAPLLPWAPAPARVEAPPQIVAAPADRTEPVAPPQPENQPPSQPPQSKPEPQSNPEPQSKPEPQSQPPQGQPGEAAANPALQALDRRVGALEARPTAAAGDIADIRREVARLGSATADLDARIAAIDKARSEQGGVDATDMALVLALLQTRGALEVGRPFSAEYEALATLARTRPEVAAAAAPLAEPAKTGLASRAVLASRLRQLAGAIATAKTPAKARENTGENATVDAPGESSGEASPDWVDEALMRLRGLVTIRRIEGASAGRHGGGPAAAVEAAERALAGGDLEGAVGALDRLTGAPADAARPWLRMAKERLAVEAALTRIEALLVARLGAAPAAAPATAPAPASAPAGGGSPR